MKGELKVKKKDISISNYIRYTTWGFDLIAKIDNKNFRLTFSLLRKIETNSSIQETENCLSNSEQWIAGC